MIDFPGISGGFSELSPGGYYLAIRVGFAFPMEEENTLPEDWVSRYTGQGFMLHDPVMRWVYANSGSIRWSEIPFGDPRDVLVEAAKHGLKFGAAVSCLDETDEGQRSFANFVRGDREFTDEELRILRQMVHRRHIESAPPTNLTRAELEVLDMVRNGLLMKQIADQIGVSQGAIKQRLKNAKQKLRAKTSTQAATLAVKYGLI